MGLEVISSGTVGVSYISGSYYGVGLNGAAWVDRTLVANESIFTYFIPFENLTIDRIGVNVRATGLGTLARIYIIDSNSLNQPNSIVYTSSDIDITTTGHKEATLSYSFVKGKVYWIMCQVNGTVGLECMNAGSCNLLGVQSGGAVPQISVRNTPAGFPAFTNLTSFSPYATFRNTTVPVQIKFRKA